MARTSIPTPTPGFSMLEIQVGDLANLAQINGRIFEEMSQTAGEGGNWTCNHQTYLMLSFLVGELCGRTIKLAHEYDLALDALSAQHKGAAV